MAPTIQAAKNCDRKQQTPGEKRSDLLFPVKYCNTLPDNPFDCKSITYPFAPDRFIKYKPTSLEKNYKHDLLTEHDLGVTIDLIDSDTYAIDPTATLQPDDERLLDDTSTPKDSKRSRHHNKAVPWLKKTEYISNEFNRYGHSSEKTETKVGYNVKKLLKEDNVYMDREGQINAINKTFSDAKIPIEKHYTKPNVYAVEELPVFPDFQLWRHPFAQVMFDTEPASNSQMEEMSQAMIRGVTDESGEQFVAYFLPTEETMKRNKDAENGVEHDDDMQYEYKMTREYNWNVKNKASKGYEENYFFVFRDGCVYYNELETRVHLSKRRLKPGAQPSNSKLIFKHRPLNDMELKTRELRMMLLEPPQEEEEEEENKENGGKENENEADIEEGNGEAESSDKDKAFVASSQEDQEKKEDNEADKASVKSSARSKSSSSSEAEDVANRKAQDEEKIFGSDSD